MNPLENQGRIEATVKMVTRQTVEGPRSRLKKVALARQEVARDRYLLALR